MRVWTSILEIGYWMDFACTRQSVVNEHPIHESPMDLDFPLHDAPARPYKYNFKVIRARASARNSEWTNNVTMWPIHLYVYVYVCILYVCGLRTRIFLTRFRLDVTTRASAWTDVPMILGSTWLLAPLMFLRTLSGGSQDSQPYLKLHCYLARVEHIP